MFRKLIICLLWIAVLHTGEAPVRAQSQAPLDIPDDLTLRVETLEREIEILINRLDLLKQRLDDLIGAGPKDRIYRLPVKNSPIRGNPDAAITLVVFGDYQSNYTTRAQHVVNRLLAEYPDTLRYVFKHFPLVSIHPQANEAALAALAAEKQNKGWEMHDLLFRHTRRLSPDLFILLAKQLELDIAQFEKDRRSFWALERLDSDEKLAVKAGVSGVPTFFLNGRLMTGWRYDFLKGQVDTILRKQKEKKP